MKLNVLLSAWAALSLLTGSATADIKITALQASNETLHIKGRIAKDNLLDVDFLQAILADYEAMEQARTKHPNMKDPKVIIHIDVDPSQ